MKKKSITFIMREQLTDGTVTVLYTDKNPVTLPYNELPVPLNSFIEKAGEGGWLRFISNRKVVMGLMVYLDKYHQTPCQLSI